MIKKASPKGQRSAPATASDQHSRRAGGAAHRGKNNMSAERTERGSRTERGDRAERSARPERAPRVEHFTERPARSERGSRTEHGDRHFDRAPRASEFSRVSEQDDSYGMPQIEVAVPRVAPEAVVDENGIAIVTEKPKFIPEILAPAADMNAFYAAMAAGADAVYLGLKNFSARMQADNFSMTELARAVDLARSENRKVYIAFNTMLKPTDMTSAGRLLARLVRGVQPHALIMQDLAVAELARQAGFEGELHFSTLANVTHPTAMQCAAAIGANRIVMPRELSIDELRQCAESLPAGMSLEYFIHGALCYCVSGRCYWSSYMGGKSGLRGRCVQPCRRVYTQKNREGRFFSCLDLSLDVLLRSLFDLPCQTSWKIEGRKKGPHYVFYTTTAYKLLRDNPNDPQARKQAEDILEQALSRPTTHGNFLPQKNHAVTAPGEQTSSGMLVGRIGKNEDGKSIIKPRFALQAQDFLRVGYEDEKWHSTVRLARAVPKGGIFTVPHEPMRTPASGTPVFLIDRRERELAQLLHQWDKKLNAMPRHTESDIDFEPQLPGPFRPNAPHLKTSGNGFTLVVSSTVPHGKREAAELIAGMYPTSSPSDAQGGGKSGKNNLRYARGRAGERYNARMTKDNDAEKRTLSASSDALWLSPRTVEGVSRTVTHRYSWWLPPVIWPNEEAQWQRLINDLLRKGARNFVLNAPWQISMFPEEAKIAPYAGPFCNVANPAAILELKRMGFIGAFVSPELSKEDMMALPSQSVLPLGVVLSGYWPMGVSRNPLTLVKPNEAFQSPKGETFWARRYGQNMWIYPAWPLDISAHQGELHAAGYSVFAHLVENVPRDVPEPSRSSSFNWDLPLL